MWFSTRKRKVRSEGKKVGVTTTDAALGAKAGKKGVDVNTATQGVAALKVEEAPKTKSKNLDVMAEYKKSTTKSGANFVVIGMCAMSRFVGKLTSERSR